MKSCSSCNLKYADDTLQFCLNDGTQLVALSNELEEPPTVFSSQTKTDERSRTTTTDINTSSINSVNLRDSIETATKSNVLPGAEPSRALSEADANEKLYSQVLSFAPVTVALIQNYWQWLYMAEYNSFQFPVLLWNLRFWVWLILLSGGAAVCILALRQNNNKGFAVVGLVVLAINFLLCLVPRR
jgi:hypothetical protein